MSNKKKTKFKDHNNFKKMKIFDCNFKIFNKVVFESLKKNNNILETADLI